MWTSSPAGDSTPPQQAILLVRALLQAGVRADAGLAVEVHRRIAEFGEAAWERIEELNPTPLTCTESKRLLGKGFALTAFLVAPMPRAERGLCWLGAVLNLMVVACDRMLDSGLAPERVLPLAVLSAGGGDSTYVARLLRRYHQQLESACVEAPVRRAIGKVLRRMFEAETYTLVSGVSVPYRFWLRKSALPFVMMGLPACGIETGVRYLRWLYKVGRFFGAVDDAADFRADEITGHPNWWRGRHGPAWEDAQRVAGWGKSILDEWDSMVPRTAETAILRETFVCTLLEWLGPANSQACQVSAN